MEARIRYSRLLCIILFKAVEHDDSDLRWVYPTNEIENGLKEKALFQCINVVGSSRYVPNLGSRRDFKYLLRILICKLNGCYITRSNYVLSLPKVLGWKNCHEIFGKYRWLAFQRTRLCCCMRNVKGHFVNWIPTTCFFH